MKRLKRENVRVVYMSVSVQQRIVSAPKPRQAQFKELHAHLLLSWSTMVGVGVGPSLHRNNTALKATPTSSLPPTLHQSADLRNISLVPSQPRQGGPHTWIVLIEPPVGPKRRQPKPMQIFLSCDKSNGQKEKEIATLHPFRSSKSWKEERGEGDKVEGS